MWQAGRAHRFHSCVTYSTWSGPPRLNISRAGHSVQGHGKTGRPCKSWHTLRRHVWSGRCGNKGPSRRPAPRPGHTCCSAPSMPSWSPRVLMCLSPLRAAEVTATSHRRPRANHLPSPEAPLLQERAVWGPHRIHVQAPTMLPVFNAAPRSPEFRATAHRAIPCGVGSSGLQRLPLQERAPCRCLCL